MITFTATPEVLQKAFSDIETAFSDEGSAGELYFYAAVCRPGSEYARVLTPEGEAIDTDHLILGAQGFGSSYTYVAVPLEGIEEEGRFLLTPTDADRLRSWAAEVSGHVDEARFVHERKGDVYTLTIEHDSGFIPLEISAIYEPFEIDTQIFRSAQTQFEQPTVEVTDELVAFFRRSETLSSKMGKPRVRIGDLTFDGSSVEFSGHDERGLSTISVNHTAAFDSAIEMVWDATPALMKMLARSSRQKECRIGFSSDTVSIPGQVGSFRLSYEVPIRTGTIYVQRQVGVIRNHQRIKRWLSADETDRDLFYHPDCKLWAIAQTSVFFAAVRGLWAPNRGHKLTLKQVELSEGTLTGDHIMAHLTGNDEYMEYVEATFGDSAVPSFYFEDEVAETAQALLKGSTTFQIRSYPHPDEGHELTNAFVMVPLPPGVDPSLPYNDARTYIVVHWAQ